MAGGCLALLLLGSGAMIRSVLLLVAVLGLLEYVRIIAPALSGLRLGQALGVSLLPAIGGLFGTVEAVLAGLVASLLAAVISCLQRYPRLENVFTTLCCCAFGALYISTSLALLGLVTTQANGPLWMVVLLALIAGSDSGAYYVGKTWGRRKLLPAVSPKKTVAGAVGGLVSGLTVALGISWLLPLNPHPGRLLLAGGLLILIGMIGDLAESVLKRSFAIKDSGTLLGGHGGVLDRIDSLLLAGPALYFLLSWNLLR